MVLERILPGWGEPVEELSSDDERLENYVEQLLDQNTDSVEVVPDKRKTSGTEGILNMDGARGFEYTWRINVYSEDALDTDNVYREHVQSNGNEYLTSRRSLSKGTDEPLEPEADQEYRKIAEQRAEEIAEKFEEAGIQPHIDYSSFEEPEVNYLSDTPQPKRTSKR